MPHATLPSPGFQALILCGPGANLDTFTANPKTSPKALVSIANRPMVWYPLEWCIRMGVTNVVLITQPDSKDAIEHSLNTNPHFTGLRKPDVLAPADLDLNTGTADIFKLPEVQKLVTGDFIVLPCDLVCELDGLSLLEEWMVLQGGLGGASGGLYDGRQHEMGIGGEKSGRRGGLGVWYSTKSENTVKKEETNFVATAPLPASIVPPPQSSLRGDISSVVYSIPTDTLRDLTEGQDFSIRHALLRKHGRVKMYTAYRDAHIYFFPFWIMEMIKRNEKINHMGEDVLGWWAKAGWQKGLGDKLGLRDILDAPRGVSLPDPSGNTNLLDEDIDVESYITTKSSTPKNKEINSTAEIPLASRVRDPDTGSKTKSLTSKSHLQIPPLLAYIQPSTPLAPLIRRVDKSDLLLNISLRLAKCPALDDESVTEHSPFAHSSKVAASTKDKVPIQCSIQSETSLIDENVTISERCNIKESVVGRGCKIGTGAKLTKCIIMEDAEVGDFVTLEECILGPRCLVEGGPKEDKNKTVLKKCEVQEGFKVNWGSEETGFQFMLGGLLQDDLESEESGGEGLGDFE
jgi:translation initiation factor eIF-2B subunit gamma